jgi:hypothetical protein
MTLADDDDKRIVSASVFKKWSDKILDALASLPHKEGEE